VPFLLFPQKPVKPHLSYANDSHYVIFWQACLKQGDMMMVFQLTNDILMGFSERLLALRKQRGLTQLALADKASMHVVQIRRYETNSSQPSLEAIRKLAVALTVSADALVFDEEEREPDNEQLKRHFEAVSKLEPDEQRTIMEVIDSILLKHDAKQYFNRVS